MYNEKIMEHFMCPQNAYYMQDSDAEGEYGDEGCGDKVICYIKVRDNVLVEVSYLVYGCATSIACASMMSVMAKGKTIEEASTLTEQMVDDALGGLPPLKKHCSNLGVGVLRYAINDYIYRRDNYKPKQFVDTNKK